jgi:hypothetical protein
MTPIWNWATIVFSSTEYCIRILLWNRKLFISRFCPILVLTKVLGIPRRTDVKNDVKNYQGKTTSKKKAIRKYVFLNFGVIMT